MRRFLASTLSPSLRGRALCLPYVRAGAFVVVSRVSHSHHRRPLAEYVELHQKRYGKQMDHEERQRKKNAREVKKKSTMAQKVPPGACCAFKTSVPLIAGCAALSRRGCSCCDAYGERSCAYAPVGAANAPPLA